MDWCVRKEDDFIKNDCCWERHGEMVNNYVVIDSPAQGKEIKGNKDEWEEKACQIDNTLDVCKKEACYVKSNNKPNSAK